MKTHDDRFCWLREKVLEFEGRLWLVDWLRDRCLMMVKGGRWWLKWHERGL